MDQGDAAADPVHDLVLAAVACYEQGDGRGAVRRLRLAILAAGRPPRRDHTRAATLKVKLAVVYTASGRAAAARRLLHEAVAVLKAARGREPDLAVALNALGVLEHGKARFAEASHAFEAAIHLMEKHGSADGDVLALAWRNLGLTQSALDQPRRAARSLLEALRQPASPAERALARFSLANAFSDMGRHRWAIRQYETLLRDAEGLTRLRVLGSLAMLREDLGDMGAARAHYGEAVRQIRRMGTQPVGDREALARVPLNAATFHASLGDHVAASRLLGLAERLLRGADGPSGVLLLSVRADLAQSRGAAEKAERSYREAADLAARTVGQGSPTVLALRLCAADLARGRDWAAAYAETSAALDACLAAPEQADPGNPYVAAAKASLGMLAFELSRRDEAHERARASLLDAAAMGRPELRWRVLLLLARLQAADGRRWAAVLLGKLAMADVCRLSAAHTEAGGSGRGYRRDRSQAFRTLADWLESEERVLEAWQVHQVGLADELFDLVRRERSKRLAPSTLGFIAAEEPLARRFESAIGVKGREADPDTLGVSMAWNKAVMATWLDEVVAEAWAPPDGGARRAAGGVVQGTELEDLEPHEPGVAVLRYLRHEAGYRLMVRSEGRFHCFDLSASPEELGFLCTALRDGMLRRDARVTKVLVRLHDHLLAPAASLLTDARELRIVPDGVVRYVPFAALHDGVRYVVERHAVSMPTAVAHPGARSRRETWRATGFGHRELAHARQEIRDSMGKVGGRVLLGTKFTREALLAALQVEDALVHVASHFAVEQARAGLSHLTLGNGATMLLDEFRASGIDLSRLELLVLSACDTGLDVADEQGLSSLAGMFSCLGARSVLATQWPVDDAASAELVGHFYAAAFAPGSHITLAEALRAAQLELLGKARLAGRRRGGLGAASLPRAAHPFFWAGYALFGDPS